ncbi:uncharacterized protein [Dysidea avara]|uniref:uncharacterized protein n=1 Tax=Dysidea avara TaxID=196820 RepID=UPI0033215A64
MPMPKRRKKAETKKTSRRKNSSRDVSTTVASPNASLEQSITSGYEVVWNDKSPVTDHDNLTSGQLGLVMKSLQGKVGLIQKKEGHQLLELFKNLPHHTAPAIKQTGRSDNRLAVITSEARSELKDLAKRLQYFDEDDDAEKGNPHSEGRPASTPLPAGQCTRSASGKTATVGMAVVESDTDTVDDSSPDHYQPVRSHHCGGVAAENLQETVNVAQHVGNSGGMAQCSLNSGVVTQYSVNSGGVAQHTAAHRGVMAGQQFHPSLSDDEELDKLFASVEVNTSCSYDNTEDEQFWCSAAIELTNQEVVGIPQGLGPHHQEGTRLINTSTPCRPQASSINTSHLDSSDFVDMLLTADDMDTFLNQS